MFLQQNKWFLEVRNHHFHTFHIFRVFHAQTAPGEKCTLALRIYMVFWPETWKSAKCATFSTFPPFGLPGDGKNDYVYHYFNRSPPLPRFFRTFCTFPHLFALFHPNGPPGPPRPARPAGRLAGGEGTPSRRGRSPLAGGSPRGKPSAPVPRGPRLLSLTPITEGGLSGIVS